MLSLHKESTLQALQRAFVSALIGSQEEWESVSGARIPKGKELDWYVFSAFQYHLAAAVTKPVRSDELFCEFLIHPSDVIVIAAVKAVVIDQSGLAAVKAIAQQKKNDKQYRQAARILFRAARDTFVFTFSKVTGGVSADFVGICEDALDALDLITEPDRVSFDLECDLCKAVCRGFMAEITSKPALYEIAVQRLLKLADNSVFKIKDKEVVASICVERYHALTGHFNPASTNDESPEHLAKGAMLLRKCCRLVSKLGRM